jgi:hypothetical protein
MAKYRLLSLEELNLLEKEFVEFLVLNGIVADDWQKIKDEEPQKAAKMIEAFSDVIMEGALRKTLYLEKTDKNRIASIHFQPTQMVLAAMEAPMESDADFTDPSFVVKATKNPPVYLKAFTKSEGYEESRETDLFKFTELGWLVSDGKLYKTLCLAAT